MKIDVHGMPHFREKTGTLCRNGSLMRHLVLAAATTFVQLLFHSPPRIAGRGYLHHGENASEKHRLLDCMKLENKRFIFFLVLVN
jgi:hypothetical protein